MGRTVASAQLLHRVCRVLFGPFLSRSALQFLGRSVGLTWAAAVPRSLRFVRRRPRALPSSSIPRLPPPLCAARLAVSGSPARAREMREMLDPPPRRGPAFKTKLCALWRRGSCPRGPSCGFAHGDGELRTPPPYSTFPPRAGPGILHTHLPPPPSLPPPAFLCALV